MLYLLLRVVLSEMSKKWWPFMLIGYRKRIIVMHHVNNLSCVIVCFYNYCPCIVTPLPIVAISVGIRYEYYGVKDSCGALL